MNLLGFFHTEKPKKNFFEQPNNQKPKTKKPQNPIVKNRNFKVEKKKLKVIS